jgi:hypothetical protein
VLVSSLVSTSVGSMDSMLAHDLQRHVGSCPYGLDEAGNLSVVN